MKYSPVSILVMLYLVSSLAAGGCDDTVCEDQCGDSEWYEECESCADGVLHEDECAEIWCDGAE